MLEGGKLGVFAAAVFVEFGIGLPGSAALLQGEALLLRGAGGALGNGGAGARAT